MSAGFGRLHPVIQHHIANTLRWRGLRPLQDGSVEPVLAGTDALLIAPTAGGKTEAAMFPLLSRMAEQGWMDVSVLYLCPLKALLNNLAPRIADYAGWLGRSAAVWHGDVDAAARRQIKLARPDVLLTTPESIESMLVSELVDARTFLDGVRAVVVDEVHAFAGDDRGWHLLAVLARLEHLLGRRVQRIGMSATVGNPAELLRWVQGLTSERPAGRLVTPEQVGPAIALAPAEPDVAVDYVGNLDNAATVLAAMHAGDKRLVFVDSRRQAEELGAALRDRGVTTFLSHSSLSAAERHESEEAFGQARDCVIVATSTLELGIDVGDLDRVIQIDAPRTVSSFLQRLGRTGRRPGSRRNCLFLCLEPDTLLVALGLLHRWSQGWVEPVTPTPSPRHIVSQQILAAALAGHGFELATWREQWGRLPLLDDTADRILRHLIDKEFLDIDGGIAFIGPEAEKHYGRRHFMELLAVFASPPQFRVLAGRREIGSVGVEVLLDETVGTRLILLAGRSWKVTHIDWRRRQCFVEEVATGGKARWVTVQGGLSFEIADGCRSVVLGELPVGVTLSRRATATVLDLREELGAIADPDRLVLQRTPRGDWRWWTWAGTRVNRTLTAWLPDLVDPTQRVGDLWLRLHTDLSAADIAAALAAARMSTGPRPLPAVDPEALRGLKFSESLPTDLAVDTAARRMVDVVNADRVLAKEVDDRQQPAQI
jgi:ATP-dependent Lhr-like helicase